MICAGQITRDEALPASKEPVYPPKLLREDTLFVQMKCGLSQSSLEQMFSAPGKRHEEYPSHYLLLVSLVTYKKVFRRLATSP